MGLVVDRDLARGVAIDAGSGAGPDPPVGAVALSPRTPGGPPSGRTWCGNCGTLHAAERKCPATGLTGPEKPGWRVAVETDSGIRGYGVLVARADDLWRARIITFPKTLWMVPGGGSTIKFLGHTEDETVRQAIDVIRRHCVQKGQLMRDEVQFLAPAPRRPAAAPRLPRLGPLPVGPSIGSAATTAPRYMRRLPVRFGQNIPTLLGHTGNLSETGLFVATVEVVAKGSLLGLSLELEHCKVPLRGSVAWGRLASEPGREVGMGLRLYSPPPVYCKYVQALA